MHVLFDSNCPFLVVLLAATFHLSCHKVAIGYHGYGSRLNDAIANQWRRGGRTLSTEWLRIGPVTEYGISDCSVCNHTDQRASTVEEEASNSKLLQ